MRRLSCVFFFPALSALASGCSPTANIQDKCDENRPMKTISVTGIARLDVEPDEASVTFTFTSTDKKVSKAHADMKERTDQFMAALKEIGVSKENILFGYSSYSPDYVYEEGKPERIVAFTTSTTLIVKTKDFSRIPDIVDVGVASSLTSLGGIEFYSTKLPEHKKTVRDMAVKAAREKAGQIARGLDIKLGKAINVSEGAWSASAGRGYGGYPGWYAPLENVANVAQQVSVAGSGMGQEAQGPVSPGTTPLNLTLDVVFEIE
jgi:uncharacterized protein YggE